MKKTVFKVKKMDCPCEERLIRMKFSKIEGVLKISANFGTRELEVVHECDANALLSALDELKLDSSLLQTSEFKETLRVDDEAKDSRLLWVVLAINFAFFIIEFGFGFLADSMGLVADSLDMLSDSFVYAISLYAVFKSDFVKKQVAKIAGVFQLLLAGIGFLEVLRRVFYEIELPNFTLMVSISALALVGNFICLKLLNQSQSDGAHIKASQIFTSNDIVINLGVILAGILVFITSSKIPDLLIGAIVFIIVLKGAIKILNLAK
ncbi:cation transporter [Campylobacter geochelonis]|uniref:cation transporter n=1 Tax=Campylobacter geochelonis TaxID=1780362 RepID=UPI0007707959|nr:cation transporter [Campylobacter geochelonis]CZE49414.1 cation efflux system protein%2C CDF family [Campylobacter geochelonis]